MVGLPFRLTFFIISNQSLLYKNDMMRDLGLLDPNRCQCGTRPNIPFSRLADTDCGCGRQCLRRRSACRPLADWVEEHDQELRQRLDLAVGEVRAVLP